MKVIGTTAKTSFFYKKDNTNCTYWKLNYIFKCSSTEKEISNYLNLLNENLKLPVAIISKEQTLGIGRHGKQWFSPPGGIWLSAAYPVFSNSFSSDIFSTSIAYFLCDMFQKESIKVKIKWPNDIFYGSKKLIGFLPRVITRGKEVLYIRLGIGMNLNNKTPLEGISLSNILNKKNLSESYWTSRILQVISKSIVLNYKRNIIISGANAFLNKTYLPRGFEKDWSIRKIDLNGNLVICKNNSVKIIGL